MEEEKGQEIEQGIEKAYEDLSEEDRKELKEIGEELEKIQPETPDSPRKVNDECLKKRIAKVCLKLINETPKNIVDIAKTSHIITGQFIWYEFGNRLDEAVGIAGELEIPQHASRNIFEMWEEMKRYFEDYTGL